MTPIAILAIREASVMSLIMLLLQNIEGQFNQLDEDDLMQLVRSISLI